MNSTKLLPILVFFTALSFGQNLADLPVSNTSKDSLFYAYKNQLKEAKENKSIQKTCEIYIQLGNFFKQSGIFPEAIKQLNEAASLAKELKNDSLQVAVENQLGEIQLLLKNYDKAQNYLSKSIQTATTSHFQKLEAIAYELLGTTYEKQSNYLLALEHQEKSLALFEALADHEGIAIVNENIGSIYEDLEQYEKARGYFMKSYAYFVQIDHKGSMNVLNNIGDTFRKTGDYETGIYYTEKAKELAKQYKDGHQLESAYRDLAKNYVFQNDYKKAYEYLQKSNKVKEREFYSQNFDQMNVLQTVYDTKVKEDQILSLTQQNQINKARQNLMWFAILVLILGGTTFYFLLNKKRKANIQLQEYEQRMMRAELKQKEIEEKNLQNEIHLKTASLSKYSLNLAQKNKLITDVAAMLTKISGRSKVDIHAKLKSLAKELEDSLQHDDEWEEFMHFFEDIHPDFIKNISKASEQGLTSTELRLAMLLRLNLSSKEIASVLRVTPDSVRVARYRLRKKLPIDHKQELVNFMLDM
ncbi:regulatory protein, luxR family [Pustulibacterium marinum]|uniref:Regulatory protein, luxR family n=1 Tax=Pustulibacterium marinum TaxID=1224947 RepID=A0A1I7EWE1_9FLAO|nr:tetratricopeptide repeat protein [Pustulibacterium marinum]SFU28253.1 regulatory protein, luxR family [Pustulibacterium marinum]